MISVVGHGETILQSFRPGIEKEGQRLPFSSEARGDRACSGVVFSSLTHTAVDHPSRHFQPEESYAHRVAGLRCSMVSILQSSQNRRLYGRHLGLVWILLPG